MDNQHPEYVQLKPAVVMHLKSIVLDLFLRDRSEVSAHSPELKQAADLYDFLATLPDDVNIYHAYRAETGEELVLGDGYADLSLSEIKQRMNNHLNYLKDHFLQLIRAQLSHMYTT